MFIAAHNGARIWGGAERATVRLLAGLQQRGHRVLLLCNEPRVMAEAARAGVPARRLHLGGDVALVDAVRLASTLRRDRPDAFVVGTYKKLFHAALGARLAGVPRVIARVGLETDTPRSAKYRVALRRWVDVVVVTADRMRQPFVDLYGEAGATVHVITNAVRPATIALDRADARARLGIPDAAPLIGAVARLDRQKRLDRLLRAVLRVGDDVHCVVAGEGAERGMLQRLAGELGIAGRVHLPGEMQDPSVVLAAIDVLAISSDREGMSNVMLEALSAGVPVVSTPVSGARDALEGEPDRAAPGIVLDGFSDEELAAALARVLRDPQLRASMSTAARARAAERFDFDRMLDRWEAILSSSAHPRLDAGE